MEFAVSNIHHLKTRMLIAVNLSNSCETETNNFGHGAKGEMVYSEQIKFILRRLGLFNLAAKLYYLINPRVRHAIQEGERLNEQFEVLLSELLSHHGMYAIQVGSHDGQTNDPLSKYITRFDWNAILIEPTPRAFAKLESRYEKIDKVLTLNIAVAAECTQRTFFYVSDDAKSKLGESCPDWYDQLSSFSKENIQKHVSGILAPYIEELEVEVATLENIFATSGFPRIDVLHVDAEGYDLEVLSSFDIHKHKPQVIIFEHKHLSPCDLNSFEHSLTSSGYILKKFNDDIVAFIPNGY